MWNAGLAELLLHSVQPEDMTSAGTMLRPDRRKQNDMGKFVDLHRFQQIGLDRRARVLLARARSGAATMMCSRNII